ncbi:MAG: zinc ribbon domain-containing protein [Minicystis sp.]
MAEGEELCTHCGAPRVAGYAACRYCKTPFVKNTQTNAIPCPRCNTLNELGAQKCVQCQTWIVVQCVFCHALSPHNTPACVKCGEAFAGAPQRFAERQSQQRLQTGLEIAGQVGNVAASVLGAAAVAGVLGGRSHEHYQHGSGHYHGHHDHHSHHEHHHYDDSFSGHQGAGIEQQSGSSGGFFGSLFGSDESSGTGAGIEQQSGSSGGFLDSVFGGDGDSGGTGAGIEQESSGGSFWDSSSSDDSSASDDSGGSFWDSDD